MRLPLRTLLALSLGTSLAFGLGCASGKAETVSDMQLARVPPEQMGPVNEARLEVVRATDDANRHELALRRADNEIRDAKSENKITDAQYEQVENSIKGAQNVDDPTSRAGSEHELEVLRAKKDVTAQRIRVAEVNQDVAYAEKNYAVARKEHAEAKLEMAKYTALVNANDPVADSISQPQLQKRLERTAQKEKDAKQDTLRPHQQLEREQKTLHDLQARHDALKNPGAKK